MAVTKRSLTINHKLAKVEHDTVPASCKNRLQANVCRICVQSETRVMVQRTCDLQKSAVASVADGAKPVTCASSFKAPTHLHDKVWWVCLLSHRWVTNIVRQKHNNFAFINYRKLLYFILLRKNVKFPGFTTLFP